MSDSPPATRKTEAMKNAFVPDSSGTAPVFRPPPPRFLYTATAWLAAAAIAMLSIFIAREEWLNAQSMAKASVLNTARILAQQTENSFDHADALLQSAGQRYMEATRRGGSAREDLAEQLRRELPYVPLLVRIGITDSDGMVTFNTGFGKDAPHGLNLADRDYFRRAKAGEPSLMYEGPIKAKLTGEWSLVLARRLNDAEGRFLGLVFAVVPLETIGALFSNLDLGPSGIVNLRMLDFAQVVRHPALTGPESGAGNQNVSQTVRDLMSQDPGRESYVYKTIAPIDGTERVYAYQKLSHSPFWMTVGRATADFAGTWRKTTVLLALVSLASIWLLLWGAARLDRHNRTLELSVAERTESLAENERFIRTITDALPGLVGYWDVNSCNRFANSAYQQWLGCSPDEMRGRSAQDLLGPERFAWHEPYILGALRGEPQQFQYALTKADGTTSHTWAHYIPDVVGNHVRGYFVLATDISELKQAEFRLQRQAEELDDLYNNAPCGYHSVDAEGKIIRINDTELAWFGQERDEVVGKKHITDFMTPASREAFRRSFPKFLAEGVIEELEMEFLRKDGSVIPALVSATSVRDGSGKFLVTRSVLVDYSRLRQEQETLSRVLAAAPVAVRVAHLANNRIAFMNKAFCELLRRDEAEALTMDASSFYVDPAAFEDIRSCLARGETVTNRLVELHLPDRPEVSNVWALASYMVIDYMGQPAVLAWIFDVTELHVARLAAEAANRELDAFAYAVSHDLRAPLRAITGFAAALAEDYGDKLDGEAHEYLTNLTDASMRMRNLIEAILRLSRSTRSDFRPQAVDLTALAEAAVSELRNAEPHRRVDCHIAPDLVGRGDQVMLGSVMQNLIGNAWKYSAATPDAAIRVYGETAGPFLRVCIADNGVGFDMRHAGKLFQPFQRLHRQDEFPGIGIGLATVQRIIRQHGGEITATASPGKGATFCFTLPLRGSHPQEDI